MVNFSDNFGFIKKWQIEKQRELKKILEMEASGGFCMLLFTVIALYFSNSSNYDWYSFFISQDVSVSFGAYKLSLSLKDFASDVLLVFFFTVVCIQLKRDIDQDILEDKKQIILPAIASIGGMITPALIYMLFNWDNEQTVDGWAIPMGTDTAFAIAVLLILGKKLPKAVKVFMLAAAIFDDIGSIFIIALFYSTDIQSLPLLGVFVCCFFLFIMNRANIVSKLPYILFSVILFFLLKAAGIQTILSGVILGLSIPISDKDDEHKYPSKELLEELQPLVSFLILPLFAFVNAGVRLVDLDIEDMTNTVTLGVFLGLFLGKQIGIFGVSYILIKMKIFKMPRNLNYKYMYGISIIAGIGFTMSIFIGHLEFGDNPVLRDYAVLGTLFSSLISTIYGLGFLSYVIKHGQKEKKLKEEKSS